MITTQKRREMINRARRQYRRLKKLARELERENLSAAQFHAAARECRQWAEFLENDLPPPAPPTPWLDQIIADQKMADRFEIREFERMQQ